MRGLKLIVLLAFVFASASSWQHLVDVKLEPDPTPGDNTIEGVDLDNNGVRDDYERAISDTYVDDDLIKVAISASQEWKSLIKISLDEDIIITQDFASEKLSNLISLNKCFSELRRINPEFETPSKLYFNTLERAMEKRKVENKLFKALKGDLRSVQVAERPCLNIDLVK
ncbi:MULTISPECIES: hypothetical protein [unclassified Salinivibrio]|uniref:hypothetical protein n=1 Tax=unclassified Salinivibrio TaxID=2636825 RepID=UPI000987A454|nr:MULTISPECIES: hypothetical protein [unclassified Salinivibrio]OOF14566.1 hypothetical protein BZG83_05445 [Salinivibrio sp. PR919]OOF15566.1 hypothetical protein BZG84_12270 [Salinivibrio sp. PR932]